MKRNEAIGLLGAMLLGFGLFPVPAAGDAGPTQRDFLESVFPQIFLKKPSVFRAMGFDESIPPRIVDFVAEKTPSYYGIGLYDVSCRLVFRLTENVYGEIFGEEDDRKGWNLDSFEDLDLSWYRANPALADETDLVMEAMSGKYDSMCVELAGRAGTDFTEKFECRVERINGKWSLWTGHTHSVFGSFENDELVFIECKSCIEEESKETGVPVRFFDSKAERVRFYEDQGASRQAFSELLKRFESTMPHPYFEETSRTPDDPKAISDAKAELLRFSEEQGIAAEIEKRKAANGEKPLFVEMPRDYSDLLAIQQIPATANGRSISKDWGVDDLNRYLQDIRDSFLGYNTTGRVLIVCPAPEGSTAAASLDAWRRTALYRSTVGNPYATKLPGVVLVAESDEERRWTEELRRRSDVFRRVQNGMIEIIRGYDAFLKENSPGETYESRKQYDRLLSQRKKKDREAIRELLKEIQDFDPRVENVLDVDNR